MSGTHKEAVHLFFPVGAYTHQSGAASTGRELGSKQSDFGKANMT